jgi:pyruvate/2-oxoglutarate/acetoin dehydrogenase E1 component
MTRYFDELVRAMTYLGNKESSVFLGQSVAVEGTAMRNTLVDIPKSKLLELPVEEEFQMGVSIGLALQGLTSISIYPRWNFLLLAVNQIVNHLDKLKVLGAQRGLGKVIIRTGIGSIKPLHPGPQHTGDFTEALKLMCTEIDIVRLDSAESIFPAYKKAYERDDGVSSLIVEWSDKYSD